MIVLSTCLTVISKFEALNWISLGDDPPSVPPLWASMSVYFDGSIFINLLITHILINYHFARFSIDQWSKHLLICTTYFLRLERLIILTLCFLGRESQWSMSSQTVLTHSMSNKILEGYSIDRMYFWNLGMQKLPSPFTTFNRIILSSIFGYLWMILWRMYLVNSCYIKLRSYGLMFKCSKLDLVFSTCAY